MELDNRRVPVCTRSNSLARLCTDAAAFRASLSADENSLLMSRWMPLKSFLLSVSPTEFFSPLFTASNRSRICLNCAILSVKSLGMTARGLLFSSSYRFFMSASDLSTSLIFAVFSSENRIAFAASLAAFAASAASRFADENSLLMSCLMPLKSPVLSIWLTEPLLRISVVDNRLNLSRNCSNCAILVGKSLGIKLGWVLFSSS